MKILNIIASMSPESGGTSQALRNNIPALAAVGVYNEVVCFDNSDSGYLGKDNFKIYPLGNGKTPYAYNKDFKNWMHQNIGRFNVIIIHGLWLYTSYGAYSAWKEYKKKNIDYPKLYVMPHGMLDPYFQKAKERKLKAIRNAIFYKFLESKVLNNCNGIMFTCIQELLLAREPFKPYKPKAELNVGLGIESPPNHISAMDDAFFKQCPGLKKGEPFLLFLSRIHHKKGVDFLLQAYIKLKAVINLPPLVIAGPGGDTEYGKSLVRIASGHNNIYFAGMISGNTKWGAFYNCEAFILPSHQENFGIAVVEAMACNKPVLITDKINIWSEIKEGGGGLVEKDDLDGTEMLLCGWNNLSPKQKADMGIAAFNVFYRHFSIEQTALKLKTILEEQING